MSYDDGMEFLACTPFDTSEGDAEQAAHHQKALDVLYLIGNAYDVRVDHMRELCDVACVSFEEFCRYEGRKL